MPPRSSASASPHLSVGLVPWRLGGPARLTIVLQGTFGVVHGGVARLLPPEPIGEGDLTPPAPGAAVLLSGHARAAGDADVSRVAVRLAVVRDYVVLDKTVHALGDRPFEGADPRRFDRMPLVWERAFGGPGHPDNPSGRGESPNLVDPRDPLRPASFGAVARDAASRLRWLAGVPLDRVALPELPPGLDLRFFQNAPSDQRVEVLHGDEWIVIDGVHASMPRVTTKLPGPRPVAQWLPSAGNPVALALTLTTLAIDVDRLVLTLTWRATIPVDDLKPRGRVEATLQPPAPTARVAEAPRPAATPFSASKTIAIDPLVPLVPLERSPMPFGAPVAFAPPPPPPPSTPLAPAPPSIVASRLEERFSEESGTLAGPSHEMLRPVVPFVGAARPSTAGTTDPPKPLDARPMPGAPWSPGGPAVPPRTAPPHVKTAIPGYTPAKTLSFDVSRELLRPVAPFTLPQPGAGAPPVAEVPGAPWSREPAPRPVPRVTDDDSSTADGVLPAEDTISAPTLTLPKVETIAPPAVVPPPVVEPRSVPPPSTRAPPDAAPPPLFVMGKSLPTRVEAESTGFGIVLGTTEVPRGRGLGIAAEVAEPDVAAPASQAISTSKDEASPQEPPASVFPVAVEPPEAVVPEAPRAPTTLREKVMAAIAAREPLRSFDLVKADLKGIDFTGARLQSCKLAGADLSGCCLKDADLSDADLVGANLSDADLSGAELARADFSRARGERATASRAKATRARFVGGNWDGAIFDGLDATGADFTAASIAGARFNEAELVDFILEGARGEGVSFDGAKIQGVRAESASLPKSSFEDTDATDSHWDRATLDEASFRSSKLDRATFERASFPRANFTSAELPRAVLTHAVAEDAVFDDAMLEGADLRNTRVLGASMARAKLKGLVLQRGDLSRVSFEGADLSGANLRAAKLIDAKLQGACLDGADLRDADLSRSDMTGASRRATKLQGAKLKDAIGVDPAG